MSKKAMPFESTGTLTKVSFTVKKRKDTEHRVARIALTTTLFEGAAPARRGLSLAV